MMPREYKLIPFEKRFWEKVEKGTTCWNWTGAVSPTTGYGGTWLDSKQVGAHRASWILHFGDIPQGMLVCHRCDNRLCVRPDHLFLGSAKDNMADASRKGRLTHGEQHHSARLTESDVKRMRELESSTSKRGLARLFDVDRKSVKSILLRKVWKHI